MAARKLITAAGGNGTAIEIIQKPMSREAYQSQGEQLLEAFEPYGAEQAGFLIARDKHFEMAGGEFCGNATRSAALLMALEASVTEVSLTVSGFSGIVAAKVVPIDTSKYYVEAVFPDMHAEIYEDVLADASHACVVDLGGIVHVLLAENFPAHTADYTARHRDIVAQLKLHDRDAVGVIWYEKTTGAVTMHPVVWVRAIDTFYYESSCGSGTIAVAAVTKVVSIIQPSGLTISAEIKDNEVVLASEMEIVR